MDSKVLVSFPPPNLTGKIEKPNQHGVVTRVGTDQCLPKKGQSQSSGRAPPSWQAAGAEPRKLESFQSQREGYCGKGNSRSEPRAAGNVLQVAQVERVGQSGDGAAELGCGRS